MEAKKRITKDSIARRTAYNEGYREGIKEVVEWINNLIDNYDIATNKSSEKWLFLRITRDLWQSKLKEWGL